VTPPFVKESFGEFLVRLDVLDRFQLLRTLQMQDRRPNTRLGDCAVALGYLAPAAVERLHACFTELNDLGFELQPTESFSREPEILVIYEPA
jgi:hypothetical protein